MTSLVSLCCFKNEISINSTQFKNEMNAKITRLGTYVDIGLDTNTDFGVFHFSFKKKKIKNAIINKEDLPTKTDSHHL